VEWAETDVVLTSTPQFDRLTDNFYNVQAIFDVIYNSHQLPQVFGVVQSPEMGYHTTPPNQFYLS